MVDAVTSGVSFQVKVLTLFAALCLVASQGINAAQVTYNWTVDWVQDVNPDGLYSRRAIGVNGQYPPPIININSTDVFTINVTNGFDDGRGTALHSHGMFFNNTGYYDGAASVTQCPIPQGQSLSYEILNSPQSPADRKMQWGTYWTHGHYSGQYVDGLRTPSVIHAEKEVYTYDDDYTILLADWYHREHDDLLNNEFLNVKNPTGAEPVPDSSLLYIAHTPANGTASYLSGYNEDAKLPFEVGKTYRLRIVNMAALSMFYFWIEGHDMRIIEADGVDMEQFPVDHLSLSVAQRYSVLVTARNDTNNNWLIHSNMNPDMFDQVPDSLQLNRTSTIIYEDNAPLGDGIATLDEYDYFDDTQLVPSSVEAMEPADIEYYLSFEFNTYSNGKNYAAFNGTSYVNAQVPSLFTALTMPTNETSNVAVYGPSSNALHVDHHAMVQVTITNDDSGNHPFHLHGHSFQVVHKSKDITSDDPSENPPFTEGQSNPMRRDTILIPGGGSATFRFRADNPGAWFLHCHIDWHLSSGLAAIIMEATDQIQENLKLPASMDEQCKAFGLPFSGNAGGVQSLTDFATLAKGPTPLTSGWTPNAIGTFTACLITCLLGIGTICWYGFSSKTEEDDEEEETSPNGDPEASHHSNSPAS